MRLYEISNEYLSLLEAIENGEIPEECIADTLEAVEGEIDIKADNIACLIKSLEADIAAIKAEEDKLSERRKKKEKEREKITEYLSYWLQNVGKEKLETPRNVISFRKSEAVEIDEEVFFKWATEQSNRDYLITSKYTETPNKTEIKKLLKCDENIPGAVLITKQNIQIK